jgi:pyrimidine operon attenuation protein/uracil phosphoribosyltransferase
MNKVTVLTNIQIEQKVSRIAYQLYEDNFEEQEIVIAGIVPNGVELAKRIAQQVESFSSIKVRLIEVQLDKEKPMGKEIQININAETLTDKAIVLVDDVLNSGKTLIYALYPFLSIPIKKIKTVVLVDRNHKRFPIAADFVGISLATTLQEHITVELGSNEEGVYLC